MKCFVRGVLIVRLHYLVMQAVNQFQFVEPVTGSFNKTVRRSSEWCNRRQNALQFIDQMKESPFPVCQRLFVSIMIPKTLLTIFLDKTKKLFNCTHIHTHTHIKYVDIVVSTSVFRSGFSILGLKCKMWKIAVKFVIKLIGICWYN